MVNSLFFLGKLYHDSKFEFVDFKLMRVLRFILGDQLSHTISSLKHCDKKNDILFLCEVHEEATYVKHHPKKIALIFSAMCHFAKELSEKGFIVDYVKLDNPNNTHSFHKELQRAIQRHKPDKVLVTPSWQISCV